MLSTYRVAALRQAGRPFAPPVTVPGLIDTGAGLSVIDSVLVHRLALEQRGSTAIHTPSTGTNYEERPQYDVAMVVGEGQPKPLHLNLLVIATGLASEGFSVLVGRDVLEHCVLTFEGPTARYKLVF